MKRSSLLLALVAVACFEPPVRERFQIKITAADNFDIAVITSISGNQEFEKEPAAKARMAAVRDAALRNDDEWARRFKSLAPLQQKITFDFEKEALNQVTRTAHFNSLEKLEQFFLSLGISAFVSRGEKEMTLELYPPRSTRASAEHVRMAKQAIDRISASMTQYVAALGPLYAYLDQHPGRAEAVFARLIGEGDPEEQVTQEEETLRDAVNERMNELTSIFQLAPGQAYTTDEIVQFVFNPFPAEGQLEISGALEEVVGFRQRDASHLAIPATGLWSAISSLELEWVTPNPVVAHVNRHLNAEGENDPKVLIRQLASTPRKVPKILGAAEVEAALRKQLVVEPVYRARWRTNEQ